MALEDRDLEQHLLCAAIAGSEMSTLWLTTRDFVDPRHRVILTTIQDMIRRDIPVDSMSVRSEIQARGKLDTANGIGSVYLAHISFLGSPTASAEYYAEQLRGITRVRELHRAAADVARMAEAEDAVAEVGELEAQLRHAMSDLPGALEADDDQHDTLETILSETDTETNWLIPGWMARQERAVVVAGEGVAKTTLLRQFAVCMSGGLNPWSGLRVADGLRVLFIDAENSRDQSRRQYRWIANRCTKATIAHGWRDRIVHKTRNDGVDIVGRDNGWFRECVERVSPDVLILSPAYKLMRGGDPKDDRDVMNLLDAIDQVRVQHDCAVLIETHAPHGQFQARDMRPFGSSVWLRWPEIGIGYQRDTDADEIDPKTGRCKRLVATDWRGAREQRDWPSRITWGSDRQPPWVPAEEWSPSIDTDYEMGDVA